MITATSGYNLMNQMLAQKPVVLFEIDDYSWTLVRGPEVASGQRSWVSDMDKYQVTVNELDGTSSISEMGVTVIDRGHLLTWDFAHNQFVGKVARIKCGFQGLPLGQFVTFATLIVDHVDDGEAQNSFIFYLDDRSRLLKGTIYQLGDNGLPTSDANPKTVYGNPMDILLDILQVEVGLDASLIDLTTINAYKYGLFAGSRLEFTLTTPPEPKTLIDTEIFKALGGYSVWDELGRFSVRFLIPYDAPSSTASLTENDIVGVPISLQDPLINVVVYRLDGDSKGSDFLTQLVWDEVDSTSKYQFYGLQSIDSRGARSAYQGTAYAQILSRTLCKTYGFEPLVLDLTDFWTKGALLQVGDYVRVTHSKVRDRQAGVMGITDRLFRVREVGRDWASGTVELFLLDMNWLDDMYPYAVAPDATPDWTSASPTEKAELQFVCDAATGKYSTGEPGNEIF